MILNFRLTIFFAFFGYCSHVHGQENSDGEIENIEVEIIKNREILLPKKDKILKKIPVKNIKNDTASIQYFFNEIDHDSLPIDLQIRPLKIQKQPIKKLYANNIKAGLGNYFSFYSDGFFNSKRNENKMYGGHYKFLNFRNGPVSGKESGNRDATIDGYLKYFSDKFFIDTDLKLDYNKFNYYGTDENFLVNDNQEIESSQISNLNWSLKAGSYQYKSPLNYHTQLNFNLMLGNENLIENDFDWKFSGLYNSPSIGKIQFDSQLNFITQRVSNDKNVNRVLVKINPKIFTKISDIELVTGFKMIYENDTLSDSEKLHFYPSIKGVYYFNSKINIFGGIDGDIEKNTLSYLSTQNLWINFNSNVFHTNKNFEIFAGIEGEMNKNISYKIKSSVLNYKNLFFFNNDPRDFSKFIISYESENIPALNLVGSISSYFNDDIFRISLFGEIWKYYPKTFDKIYHRPSYKFRINTFYNLFDKFTFEIFGLLEGGIYSFSNSINKTIKLDSYFDLNWETNYIISDNFSSFIQLNNLLSKNYQRYYGYNTRGFQILIGANYIF